MRFHVALSHKLLRAMLERRGPTWFVSFDEQRTSTGIREGDGWRASYVSNTAISKYIVAVGRRGEIVSRSIPRTKDAIIGQRGASKLLGSVAYAIYRISLVHYRFSSRDALFT